MNERDIFIAALQKNDAAACREYLDEVCGTDGALRQRIEGLLQAQEQAGSFLERPAADPGATGAFAPPLVEQAIDTDAEAPGTVIGPYKLLQQIGEGGMGTVYMAEQTQPVKRKVALKVIKPGMDSRQVIARFEAERQALAMMDHVNIARVLDAGATPSGRPYFVMELVHGVSITKYCDDNHLTPRERLELFVPVCQAIQHAHQKGIIHRDVKPSNVMVTLYDGKPVPKVIDFGVAKATEQKLTERTLFTQYGTMVGTLEYMSPEQAEMSALGVDTRSDIYSLGVLLYELLTGTTPLSRKRIREAAYGDILRMIKEEEPPKPSTRLSDSGEALASISAQRKTEPAKLSKLMRGELDWIVMKTLEKDRNRRYETANAFAADVQRYLNDETVQACPPSAWYRFRKFAGRNKKVLTTGTIIVVAMVLGTAISVWQAVRATEAMNSEREARIDLDHARKLADERADRIAQDLERLNSANSLIELSRLHVDEGQWDQAEIDLTNAVQLRPDHSQVWSERGQFYLRLSLWDLAAADFAHAQELQEPPWAHHWYLRSLLCYYLGDTKGYRRLSQRMVDRFAPLDKPRDDYTIAAACALSSDPVIDPVRLVELAKRAAAAQRNAWCFNGLAMACYRAGRYQDAVQAIRDSLAIDPNWNRGWNYSILAMAHHRLGQANLARQEVTEANQALEQQVQKQLYGKPGYLPTMWWHMLESQLRCREAKVLIEGSPPAEDPRLWVIRGRALAALGRNEEAAKWINKALEARLYYGQIRLALVPPTKDLDQLAKALAVLRKDFELHPDQASGCQQPLARKYFELGESLDLAARRPEAVEAYSQALALDTDYEAAWLNRGYDYQLLGQDDNAIADYSKAIELNPKLATARYNRGLIHRKLGQLDKAVIDHSKAIELDPKKVAALYSRGQCYGELGETTKAIGDYTKAIELDPEYSLAWHNRGWAFDMQGQPDKAITDYTKAIELDPEYVLSWFSRGATYGKLGQLDKAIGDYSKAIELDPKYALARYNRGWAYGELLQMDKAINDYAKCIELDPNYFSAWINRGFCYSKSGQTAKAITDYAKAIELNPTSAPAWSGRAEVYSKLGQTAKAISDFSKAIELDSSHVEGFNRLAWLLATCPDPKFRDPGRAVDLAKKAVELAPKNGNHSNTLGVAQYRAGDWKEAITALQRSMELRNGGEAFDWFFLAMAQWKLEEKHLARKWYDQAVQWMDKNASKNEELLRFRAEAKDLLGIEKSKD